MPTKVESAPDRRPSYSSSSARRSPAYACTASNSTRAIFDALAPTRPSRLRTASSNRLRCAFVARYWTSLVITALQQDTLQ